MFLKGYKNRDIQEVLEVSPGFIGQKTKLYKLLVYLGWNWQSHEGQSVIWNLLKAQQSFGGCRQKTGSSQKCKDTYSRTTMWCFTPNKAITHCLTRHGLGEKKLKNATLNKTQQCSKKKTGDYRLVGEASSWDYFWQVSGIFTAWISSLVGGLMWLGLR